MRHLTLAAAKTRLVMSTSQSFCALFNCSLGSMRCDAVPGGPLSSRTSHSCSRIALWIRRRRRPSQRKERLRSPRAYCSLRSLRLALVSRCLPPSLADERRVCSLARPGQRRASLAPYGGARFRVCRLAPLAAFRAQQLPSSSSLPDGSTCPLVPPQHGSARNAALAAQ